MAAQNSIFFFGLGLLLIANTVVAVSYRTNLLFVASLGVAIMTGVLASAIFQSFSKPVDKKKLLTALTALMFFGVYLAVNIHTYLEIQWALRPEGYLATTWDRWVLEDAYLPWIQEEQLQILEAKLRKTGKLEWAEFLPRVLYPIAQEPILH